MEITGKLIEDYGTVYVSEKFSKREFVVETSTDMYPQPLLVQLTQEKCSLLDGINVGDEINVAINLRGRKWENKSTGEVKYFNSIEAWKIVRINGNSNNKGSNQGGNNAMPFK